jgi:PKD domain-containing protein
LLTLDSGPGSAGRVRFGPAAERLGEMRRRLGYGVAALLLAGCGQQQAQAGSDPAEVSGTAPLPGGMSQQRGRPGTLHVSTMTVGPAMRSDDPRAPYAWINDGYVIRVGGSTTFDGSGSYSPVGGALTYHWDFDDDGVVDSATRTPEVTRRFTQPYSGVVVLTVTDAAGRSATATAHLAVSDDGDETPAIDDNCPKANNPGQEDYDHDGVGDMCDPTPGWPTQDASGVTESTD